MHTFHVCAYVRMYVRTYVCMADILRIWKQKLQNDICWRCVYAYVSCMCVCTYVCMCVCMYGRYIADIEAETTKRCILEVCICIHFMYVCMHICMHTAYLWVIYTAIPIIIEGQFQVFQRFSSSELVLKAVESCFVALDYYGNGSMLYIYMYT